MIAKLVRGPIAALSGNLRFLGKQWVSLSARLRWYLALDEDTRNMSSCGRQKANFEKTSVTGSSASIVMQRWQILAKNLWFYRILRPNSFRLRCFLIELSICGLKCSVFLQSTCSTCIKIATIGNVYMYTCYRCMTVMGQWEMFRLLVRMYMYMCRLQTRLRLCLCVCTY